MPPLRAGLVELELARANVQNLQHHGRDAVKSLAALHALAEDATGSPSMRTLPPASPCSMPISSRAARPPKRTPQPSRRSELLKQTEKDPRDTYQLRESALAWQQTGEIGLRASQPESACRYLGLAAKRYDELGASQRLNAIDKLRQGQVQALRKACG